MEKELFSKLEEELMQKVSFIRFWYKEIYKAKNSHILNNDENGMNLTKWKY